MSTIFRRSSRGRREQDLDCELRAHLEWEEQEQLDAGLTLEEARRAAHRGLGNLLLVKDAVREAWGWGSMDRLLQDVRGAVRLLAKNPGFTAVSAAALALGIGVNTAIFSFADIILTRPVSLPRLDRLVSIRERASESGDPMPQTPAAYLALRSRTRTLAPLAAYQHWGASLGGPGDPEMIPAARVTAEFFDAVGGRPALGRVFQEDEQEPGRNRVVVLSYRFWQQRFAGDPLVGSGMRLTAWGLGVGIPAARSWRTCARAYSTASSLGSRHLEPWRPWCWLRSRVWHASFRLGGQCKRTRCKPCATNKQP